MTIVGTLVIAVFVLGVPIVTLGIRRNPKSLMKAYLLLGLFIPYWLGISLGGQFLPLIFLLSVGALLMIWDKPFATRWPDRLLFLVIMICIGATITGRSGLGNLLTTIGAWLVPYMLGRMLGARISVRSVCSIFSFIGGLLAVQALVEFIFNWHPFVGLTNVPGPGLLWSSIQYRGGFPRSEGALGHSISMGNVLAICVPFIVLGPLKPRLKVSLISLVIAATMVTFSRNALVAIMAALALALVFATAGKISNLMRVPALGTLVAGILVVAPLYLTAIAGNANDLQDSTDYRLNYSSVIPTVEWLGQSSIYVQYAPGQWGWASSKYPGGIIRTLDNTLLLFALQFGWIPLIVLAVFLLSLLIIQIRRTDNPALIAVTSQFGTVLTVAMITQFAYIYWLVLGFAVSYHFAERALLLNQRESPDVAPREFDQTYNSPIESNLIKPRGGLAYQDNNIPRAPRRLDPYHKPKPPLEDSQLKSRAELESEL